MEARKERVAVGKAMRDRVPRSAHGEWKAPARRKDPVELLIETSKHRDQELLPYRWDRMKTSHFAFLRGAAAVMAADLASMPSTRFRVHSSGDGHLMNFGMFATPERELIFDLNDFDETHIAPFEWDVKRLAASAAVAAEYRKFSTKQAAECARTAAEAYRTRVRELAETPVLASWYSRVLADDLPRPLKRLFDSEKAYDPASAHHLMPRWVKVDGGAAKISDAPPFLFHPPAGDPFHKHQEALFQAYRKTLPDERRMLLDRFHLADFAVKVVGVGSVGTRCAVGLLLDEQRDPLFLQIKEAEASVLEPYMGKSRYRNHGERVVTGQRILQAASDIFLGWASFAGRDFYVRQLRDRKASVTIDQMDAGALRAYAALCGRTLARAHARGGDIVPIAAYLGAADAFDQAIARFAVAYARQTERDHAALLRALRSGRLPRVSRAHAAR